MILPNEKFLTAFKKTSGALSVTESIAIMNIAAQAPTGLWIEGGTHKGKSAMSAVFGGECKEIFLLIDTEFEKTIPTSEVAANIAASIDKGVKLAFSFESFLSICEKSEDKFAYVFSDAGAHDDEVMKEAQALEDKIIIGGIICFHDFLNQFTAVQRAYEYLVGTGKYDPINIEWEKIIPYVRENNLEQRNNSWHVYEENPFPNFVGALKRK